MLPERQEPERQVVTRGRAQSFQGGALGEDVGMVGQIGVGSAPPGAQRLLQPVDLLLDLGASGPPLVRPGRELRGERVEDAVPRADGVDEGGRVDRGCGEA